MILDTSAILAILFVEAEQEEFVRKIDDEPVVGVGAPTLAETATVLASRRGEAAVNDIQDFVVRSGLVVIAFDLRHWKAAGEASRRYGRGRHPARLNFGDCLAYATARIADEPLLCKSDDFAKTDLVLA